MELKGESHTVAEGLLIAAPNWNDAVIAEMRQKKIPKVFLDGCAFSQNRGWVLTDGKVSLDALLPINADSTRNHCLPERNSPIF
jgi:hypothetical protein